MKRWLIVCFLLFAGVAFFCGGFDGKSFVCRGCARVKYTRTLFWVPFSNIKETELSTYLTKSGLLSSEERTHGWLAAHGGGSTFTSSGPALSLEFAYDKIGFPKFFNQVIKYEGVERAKEYLALLREDYGELANLFPRCFQECKTKEEYERAKHLLGLSFGAPFN